MSLTATIVIILLASTVASFIQRVTGFGFGIFIMTILPLIMPSYGEATALSGSLAVVNSCYISIRMWKHIPWKKLLPILLTFIFVSFFAIRVVADFDDRFLKHILGVILIAIGLYFTFISSRVRVRPTMPVQITMGTASGLMGGIFAMQGPPAVLYFISCTDSKEEYLAITQAFFMFGNLMMTGFRAANGFVTREVGLGWCCGLVGVMMGIWIGAKVFDRIPLSTLRKVVYLYMVISGIVALMA